MLTELFAFVMILCAVVIIMAVLNKNKKLQHFAAARVNMYADLESTVKQMAGSGSDNMKIVKYVRERTNFSVEEAKKFVENIK